MQTYTFCRSYLCSAAAFLDIVNVGTVATKIEVECAPFNALNHHDLFFNRNKGNCFTVMSSLVFSIAAR